MTEKEKEILVRLLLATRKLLRATKDKTAKDYARQMADAISDLVAESEKRG